MSLHEPRYATLETAPSIGVRVNTRPDGVTLEADGRVLRFDANGRLTTFFDGTHSFRRGLDNTVVEKWWEPIEADPSLRTRRHRFVDDSTRNELLEVAYRFAHRTLSTFRADGGGHGSVDRVLATDPVTLESDAATFDDVYGHVGILPPDQYRAVVVQGVTGCPFSCSFCSLYRDIPVSSRSLGAFTDHVEDVASFHGPGIASRRSIFFGAANPLAAPDDDLIAQFDVINDAFPDLVSEGVYAFANARTLASTSIGALEALYRRGLRRVYVGVESGLPAVLELLEKPQTVADVETGIARAKRAGLAVGVLVMAGVGGYEYATDHETETLELVTRLGLDERDVVYVSPLVTDETSRYWERASTITALGELGNARQTARLRKAIDERVSARVSTYRADGFVYS